MNNLIKKIKPYTRIIFHPESFFVFRCALNLFRPSFALPKDCYEQYKNNTVFIDRDTYLAQEKTYLSKHQTFEEYSTDSRNPPKKYIDLSFAVYFQTYNNRLATEEALRSFRTFYPDVSVRLLSDHGEDFSDLAKKFKCDYTNSPENLGYWPVKNMRKWFARLADTCNMYADKEWILILEDDVRTRDKISKHPNAHLAGQGGGTSVKKKRKQLSLAAQEFIKKIYPEAKFDGISGCGASIFHRQSFLDCLNNPQTVNFEKFGTLDAGIPGATDIALTFLFMMNGYIVRRWFDMSEESRENWGPAAAFDHQYKKYYKANSLQK